jgi:hypothetical protein
MFYESYAYSFPRICHIFLSHDAKIVVSLSEKGNGRISGRYFNFKEYDYLWFKQLYHVRKKLWMETAIGTKLLLFNHKFSAKRPAGGRRGPATSSSLFQGPLRPPCGRPANSLRSNSAGR